MLSHEGTMSHDIPIWAEAIETTIAVCCGAFAGLGLWFALFAMPVSMALTGF